MCGVRAYVTREKGPFRPLWLNRHVRYLGFDTPKVNHQDHQREMNERDEYQISSLTLYDHEVRGEGYHPSWKCSND